MSDGAMCHYCRKYKCECIEEDLRDRIVRLEAELKAEREQRERGCWHCKHFIGYHHAGKIDGQCTVKDCQCANYQTATEVIQEEHARRERAEAALRWISTEYGVDNHIKARCEEALKSAEGGRLMIVKCEKCHLVIQILGAESGVFEVRDFDLDLDLSLCAHSWVVVEALKSVSSDPKERT